MKALLTGISMQFMTVMLEGLNLSYDPSAMQPPCVCQRSFIIEHLGDLGKKNIR